MVLQIASWISGLGFLVYGYQCLRSPFMYAEFERFQVPHYRTLTGVLEILGGLGVLLGLIFPWIGMLASLGLCILMFLGVVTRIKIKDSPIQCLSAAFFCLINGWIAVLHLHGS
ncbi:MAG: DoxX family protein [Bdellovibrionales bacterium]|nr:DoxX family protein [Bdellovibrionales bacterium]